MLNVIVNSRTIFYRPGIDARIYTSLGIASTQPEVSSLRYIKLHTRSISGGDYYQKTPSISKTLLNYSNESAFWVLQAAPV
mmetsp:Transcript_45090/g.72054  ORF Transcript_45090/g.72054 Transcript_45090/m.72054 type:complete len:81 (-) Transcript_45090:31-273(-)